MASLLFAWFFSICVFDIFLNCFFFHLRVYCICVLSLIFAWLFYHFTPKLGIVQLLNIWCSEVGKIEAAVLELS